MPGRGNRALVIDWCGAREQVLPLAALSQAEDVFITSATRDVLPVHAVDERVLGAPGPVTKAAMTTFATRSALDRDP
jgi:branched-chain amino acid aminotransferase